MTLSKKRYDSMVEILWERIAYAQAIHDNTSFSDVLEEVSQLSREVEANNFEGIWEELFDIMTVAFIMADQEDGDTH